MKYRSSIFFVCLILPNLINAQSYNASLISDSLLANAHAVKRMEEFKVIIKSNDKVIVKHKYAITILDAEGEKYAAYENNYSSLKEISNIDGNLYDALGKKISSVKRKDIEDIPDFDGFSLMQDDRIKRHQFFYRQYPYTVEYEDEEERKESYFLPFWYPVEGASLSVEQSAFSVEVPEKFGIRIKQVNLTNPPIVTNTKEKTYAWTIRNYKAISQEPFQGAIKDLLPIIYIGANSFSIGGYSGDMDTWKNLGKFNVTLNQGRDELPQHIKQEIHALTDALQTREEKINKVYQYLQQNTRYISIQLGIGGWQPFDAKFVASKKYGDCKALSNYMVSLLKEIGIKGYYVLITAGKGRKGLSEDFPAPYFNHVICCVPNNKDTIWLECTSQTSPPGYLGSFTENRKALLIGDDGGYVVTTPIYSASQNLQTRLVKADISQNGNLNAVVSTHFYGIQYEGAHQLIHYSTPEERESYLNNVLNISTYQVDKFEYNEKSKSIPEATENLHIQATGYANVSGKRIFFVPNFLNQSSIKLSNDQNRKYPIQFSQAYTDIDTLEIQIPDGYIVEAGPKDISLSSEFGEFSFKVKYSNQLIQITRYRKTEMNTFPPTAYPALIEFYNKIYSTDHSRIVLVKKDAS